MSHWVKGFGITDAATKIEILPIMCNFNLDHFEEIGNLLFVEFSIYPNGSKACKTEINPFEKTFTHATTTHNLSNFRDYFRKIA